MATGIQGLNRLEEIQSTPDSQYLSSGRSHSCALTLSDPAMPPDWENHRSQTEETVADRIVPAQGSNRPMRLIPLTCAQCDAPIRVEEGQKSVICEHCETQLLIEKRAEGIHTEIVEEILRRTENLAKELKALKAERNLKSLDKRWRHRRRRLAQRSDDDHKIPTASMVLMSLVGSIYLLMSGFWLLGIMALVLGTGIAFTVGRRRKGLERARQSYRRRRRRLVAQVRKTSDASSSIRDGECAV